jgi:hypothetical protein
MQWVRWECLHAAMGARAPYCCKATDCRCCCLPIFTTGQLFLHSCLHFLGLHLNKRREAC